MVANCSFLTVFTTRSTEPDALPLEEVHRTRPTLDSKII